MAAVTMPRLSDSMEEGTIVRWLRAAGEQVSVGDELVEIETDKATMAYEAEAEGVLTIAAEEGTIVRVGETIAHIGEAVAGADAGAAGNGAAGLAAPAVTDTVGPAVANPVAPTATSAAARHRAAAAASRRVKASPVARRLAAARGVSLEALMGTGPAGRIVKRDVEAVASTTLQGGDAQSLKASAGLTPLGTVQAKIARRMAEAKATMPDFALTCEIDMEAVVALRAQFAALERTPVPSLGDFVVKAVALALREHPRVNASFRDGGIERYGRVNVGVAVAAAEALFVPAVLDADRKALVEIAAEVRELAERGRAGRLRPAEMDGATFTVSNLGMFGITQFTAVLNPPQAAILAVGSVEQRVVADHGAPAVRQRATVTLTCDHRVLYGADAAAFLASVRANLELPLKLV